MGNFQDKLKDPITEKKTERGSFCCEGKDDGNPLQYAASGMQGWRTSMEDQHIMCPSIRAKIKGEDGEEKTTTLKDHAFFAVLDGHGGTFTSKYAGQHMVKHLTNQSESWTKYIALSPSSSGAKGGRRNDAAGIELLKKILTDTFLSMDAELESIYIKRVEEAHRKYEEALAKAEAAKEDAKEEHRTHGLSPVKSLNAAARSTFMGKDEQGPPKPRIERSGSTCIGVLLTPTHILCANAGDSRAVLSRSNSVVPLSFDHKPHNLTEVERIKAAGGYVRIKRVDGDLAVSRGLGDFTYKNRPDLPPDQQKVIAKPDVLTYPRRAKEDEFIIIACDGIWDVLNNKQAVGHVRTILDEGETDVGLLCEEMLDTCLEKNSRDNMTISILTLPGLCMKDAPTECNAYGMKEAEGSLTGVMARRADRDSRAKVASISAQKKFVAQNAVDGEIIVCGKSFRKPSSATQSKIKSGKTRQDLSAAYAQSATLATEITTEVEVTHNEFEKSMNNKKKTTENGSGKT